MTPSLNPVILCKYDTYWLTLCTQPHCTLMASSVAKNPQAAHDGLGGHSNLLSPESKPNCQSEPQSPYMKMKSCSVLLTPLKGSQSVTQSLPSASNKFSTFNKPPCTLMASSVAKNPEAAYDGLGGHSKGDAFPVPQKKLKYGGTSKPKKKVTMSYK